MCVVKAVHGEADLSLAWKRELGQYSGFLHVGVISALLDTVAGFAAATVAMIASHLSANFLIPAVGSSFSAAGQVVRAGKRQIFARSELFASTDSGERKLVATGEVLMLPA
jgi:uncharacterized protein (TIGR00369 family)